MILLLNTTNNMLKREKHKMPTFIKSTLESEGLMNEYKNRPPYQQNDYVGWITRAKREETQQKRLRQMIDELRRGNVYMKMKWGRE